MQHYLTVIVAVIVVVMIFSKRNNKKQFAMSDFIMEVNLFTIKLLLIDFGNIFRLHLDLYEQYIESFSYPY